MNTRLDDATTVNLFAVLVTVPVLAGGIFWLTSIDAKASQALRETSKIEKIQEAVTRLEIKFGTLPSSN